MRSSAEMPWKKQDAILVKGKTDANYSDNMVFFECRLAQKQFD